MPTHGTMRGRIEIVCGCMFSGKTEHLLSRVEQARRAATPYAVFKHASDDRYSETLVVSHSGRSTPGIPVANASDLLSLSRDAQLVLIDEAQFFDGDLVSVCQILARQGKHVVVCGLDNDSWGMPFGPMPQLLAIADRVIHTTATCTCCGSQASQTQRIAPVDGNMIGGAGSYEPRCTTCWAPPPLELRC